MQPSAPVSVHGGHSGQFCNHATDTLEEIILRYIELGFPWVGITEHAPGISRELLYPDQRAAGLTPEFLLQRFGLYMAECRRLQEKYRQQIKIFAAIESETYSGYREFMPYLLRTFQPDYVVGSVHFVDDLGFDYSREQYQQTAAAVGGTDALYLRYFDLQYEMIAFLKPAVVGHFDLIRIFDPDYRARLTKPEIVAKIRRNLELIKDLGLIMDFNLRSLLKGASEPYITTSILAMAREMDIAVVPGDDSHGVANVGLNMERGIAILVEMGFPTRWPEPKMGSGLNS